MMRSPALGLVLSLAAASAGAEPLYDATVDTVFDIITRADPSAFDCLDADGMAIRQMWDKRTDAEIHPRAHIFTAHYAHGAKIEITVNPEFDATHAEAQALRHAEAVGRLPVEMLAGWRRLGIHAGAPSYSAGTGLAFVYAGRSDWLEGFDHLEESLFHEGVHVTFGAVHDSAARWRAAQAADGQFLTGYAVANPENEDMTETLLFAYGLQLGRMPPADARDIRRAIPARLAYIASAIALTPPGKGRNAGRCAS